MIFIFTYLTGRRRSVCCNDRQRYVNIEKCECTHDDDMTNQYVLVDVLVVVRLVTFVVVVVVAVAVVVVILVVRNSFLEHPHHPLLIIAPLFL